MAGIERLLRGGFVLLHRSLLEHPLWTRERFTPGQAWVDLIMLASYADHVATQGNRPLQVCRGQVLTSQVALAKRWRWDRETVRRFFRLLESLNMCHIETSKATDTGYTLATIVNYDTYQTDQNDDSRPVPASDAPSGAPSNPASMPHPCPTINKGNKGNKRKDLPASGLTLEEYLERFSPEGQEVLRQTVAAIASTRKSGKVAQSVLDSLARELNKYPPQVVLQACQIYLTKNHAGQGRGEAYLLGIVRGEAKRQNSNGREPSSPVVGQKGGIPTPVAPAAVSPGVSYPYPNPTTEGQWLMNRAWLDQQQEQAQ